MFGEKRNQSPPSGWRNFDVNELRGAYPPDWQFVNPPVSPGASLCIAKKADALLEIFHFAGGRDLEVLSDFLAHSIATVVPFSEGYRNGAVLKHDTSDSADGVRQHRVVVAYQERGMSFKVDYVVAGVKKMAVQAGLKCVSHRLEGLQSDYRRVLTTLRTPWLPAGIQV